MNEKALIENNNLPQNKKINDLQLHNNQKSINNFFDELNIKNNNLDYYLSSNLNENKYLYNQNNEYSLDNMLNYDIDLLLSKNYDKEDKKNELNINKNIKYCTDYLNPKKNDIKFMWE